MSVPAVSNRIARQPLAAAAAAAPRHARLTGKSLRCCAKGNQKNEGMYFEYVPVDDSKEPTPEEQKKHAKKEQQQFGWASAARSSVQQYRKTVSSKRPKPPNKPQQQQQQQQQQQESGTTAAAASDTAAQAVLQPQPEQSGLSPSAGVQAHATAETGSVASETSAIVQQQQNHTHAGSSSSSSSSTDTSSNADTPAASSSSRNRATLSQRKQQMLQRMKGAASAAGSTAAAAPAAAAAAVPASAPLIEPEGQVLLQELLELAEQLAGPDGYNSVIDSDPLSDPLAGFLGDDGTSGFSAFIEPYVEEVEGSAAGLSSDTSPEDGFAVSGFDDAEAEELFAAVAEMQQRSRAAARALEADDDDAAAAAAGSSSSEAASSRPGSLAAELLAWEAEELAQQPQIDMEAAAAALERGEVLGADSEDEYEDGGEDEYEADREDEDWLERDPQLKQMLQADGAAFARMLAAVNGEDDEPTNSGSKGTAAAAAAAATQRGVGSEQDEQRESWSGLGLEDWLEASGSSAADREVHSPADEELLGEDAGLSDLLSQIDADPSLDSTAKMQARMSIQGVFNDPAAAAAAAAGSNRKRADRDSSKRRSSDADLPGSQQQQQQGAAGTAAAAGDDGQEEAPALLPKPVRPANME